MLRRFPLCLALLPVIAMAHPGPGPEQAQAAVDRTWAAEMEDREPTTRLPLGIFKPQVQAVTWCLPASEASVDCSVRLGGTAPEHRMMRFSRQGEDWRWELVGVPVPRPPVVELAPALQALIDRTIAEASGNDRQAIEEETRGMRLVAVERCVLASDSGQLQCMLEAGDDAGRRSSLRVELHRVDGQWQLLPR